MASVRLVCLFLNPEKDLNHLHIMIKIDLDVVPPYVTTLVQIQVTQCKISIVQCSGKSGSSRALFFPCEMFVPLLSLLLSYQLIAR